MGNSRYIAVFSDSAFTGVGIIEIEHGIEDYVINEYYRPTGVNKRKNKVYTAFDGRCYIIRYGKKYYLDEFLKLM